jgi:hypothetical protein
MTSPDTGDTATMRAVVIASFGGSEQLHERHVPAASKAAGQDLTAGRGAGKARSSA